jgi:cytochrome bd-type quinol oxidase subunit 2
MGSAVSIAVTLLMTGVVFLLIPQYAPRIEDEIGPLWWACLLSAFLAAIATTSFYGEVRRRGWRFAAHLGLTLMLAVAFWTYWPKS